jgi:hypothetical protein
MVHARFDGRVAIPPAVAIVAAIGIRIAGSKVLAICIRVELRAIAGVRDNLLRHRGCCESCHGNTGGANQREFHLDLLDVKVDLPDSVKMETRLQFRQLTFG